MNQSLKTKRPRGNIRQISGPKKTWWSSHLYFIRGKNSLSWKEKSHTNWALSQNLSKGWRISLQDGVSTRNEKQVTLYQPWYLKFSVSVGLTRIEKEASWFHTCSDSIVYAMYIFKGFFSKRIMQKQDCRAVFFFSKKLHQIIFLRCLTHLLPVFKNKLFILFNIKWCVQNK